uniref:Uncharacterized protein n=1 Tax=Sphaerodactylus townsendi TaxID=933632 RepID=A0ACB8F180_9SAUR
MLFQSAEGLFRVTVTLRAGFSSPTTTPLSLTELRSDSFTQCQNRVCCRLSVEKPGGAQLAVEGGVSRAVFGTQES